MLATVNNKLWFYLQSVYGENAIAIKAALGAYLEPEITSQPAATANYWYKFVELYCVYPDSVIYEPSLSPLKNLNLHLNRIKTLGCNAIHILPFLESPMVDKGFDVSDYYQVRKSLGTLQDLRQLGDKANQLNLKLFMDFVLNHVSEQHQWFQQAQQGDEKYRNYFIHTACKPQFIRKFYKNSAIWAEYLVNGEVISVNIAFPEFTGALPHWRQGGDSYWYYHTYYPQQIDLNWLNPDVFIEYAKILIYWLKLGFNFRLDAIPFIGKGAYKQTDTINYKAHAITAALKCLAESLNPAVAFLVESYEALDTVIKYFGSSGVIQSNLSYNFHLCTSIWVSIVKQDASYIWEKLDSLSPIPEHAEWLNFLRNHDELSLAYLPDKLLKEMQAALLKYGGAFREGCGISGRTYSLLATNKDQYLMAYFLLASMPGGLVIPYGDEIACQNIALDQLPLEQRTDSRNINRGILLAEQYNAKTSQTIFKDLATILSFRKILRNYLNVWPLRQPSRPEIFAATYENFAEKLSIYINLSNKPQIIPNQYKNSALPAVTLVAQLHSVEYGSDTIQLGPYAGIWIKH